METAGIESGFGAGKQFQSNLRGMETHKKGNKKTHYSSFQSNLRGMETGSK